jgi:two-component system cell cycle response regulator
MSARILVIEDNAVNMELMTYLLQAFGHATLKARDGREGLEIAARERPDLIICDLQMPLMSGYEVAQRLKSDPALCGTPLLAVTAFAMVDDRKKTLAAGFDGYFTKPIAPETFVQQVQGFLPLAQRTGAAPPESATTDSRPPQSLKGTVLVTDDEQINLDLASSILGGSGYRVLTALSMDEALRLARESPPDLILSDVSMAEGSGYDFIQTVKSDPRLNAIPFVFLTSTMTSEGERRKGLSLGAEKFLFRPIDPQTLLREIQDCLGKPGKS